MGGVARETTDHTHITVAGHLWRWCGWALGFAITAAGRELLIEFSGDDMVAGIINSVGAGALTGGKGINAFY